MTDPRGGDEGREAGRAARGVAVAVLGESELVRRLARTDRPARMERKEIQRVLARVDPELAELGSVGEPHVTLSPRVPWVADRGHLLLIKAHKVDPSDPFALFYEPETGCADCELEVWLRGLETGASYFAELRVSSVPYLKGPLGQWTLSGSLGPALTLEAAVGPQTLPVVLHAVADTQAVIRLRATVVSGWWLYDAEVSKLG